MPYTMPVNPDFNFLSEPYTPEQDFAFYPTEALAYSIPPSVVRGYAGRWSAGSHNAAYCRSGYSESRPVAAYRSQGINAAREVRPQAVSLFWGAIDVKQASVKASHGTPEKHERRRSSAWNKVFPYDASTISQWDKSIDAKDDKSASSWNQPAVKDQHNQSVFSRVDEFGAANRIENIGYIMPSANALGFMFGGAFYNPTNTPSVFFRMGRRQSLRAIQPRDTFASTGYSSNASLDGSLSIPWGLGIRSTDGEVTGKYGGEKDPDVVVKPEPVEPDIRESYLLMNTINTVVLPDRVPLELPSLEISLDIDSFSWSFTGQLVGATNIALVEPNQNGPKQIEVTINGWKWVFIIERYSTDRRFGNERYTLYGSSRTQLLAAPYAPMRSKSNSNGLNAKQAITEELANTGFTATYPQLNDYSTPDWIMPAGSFSYQNQTAMQVVASIAGTAGSVIIPDKAADQLAIQPRYPASPWAWSTATMDKIVPASMVISLSASWRPEQTYNAVYVSGTHAGVAVNVKRTGSNGDNPSPDILEDWLTETQVNTERGRNELAKGGNQSITTIELPLTDTNTAPGLIEPGSLVEVQDTLLGESGDWQALCLATSINASGVGSVVQSIELERHY